ncbi:MAG: hypothetical protein CCU27_05445 [Nitrospira sp. UW-LDO-02]|nr:MAG: hypothetical protein CCU27_05445 [Nitrospira sp. UW-LDO-02]
MPVVALTTLVLLVWIGWGSVRSPASFWAPGELSRYHVDQAGCLHCHEPFRGPSPARCVSCHSDRYFADRATRAVTTWHRDLVAQRTACTACHTEHRGALAQITERTRTNPHGEFVFRATGTSSCTACHEFGARVATKPTLRDEPIVRQLYERGRGAHQPGRIAECLACHGRGAS